MTTPDPSPALLLKNLSKVFRSFRTQKATEVVAVNNISLRIEPGEIVGLLGPNGAGKSTLVDMILGLISPTSGTVEVFGQSPKDMIRQSRLGAVMQTGGLLPELTVEETIAMIATTHKTNISVSQALEQANLLQIRKRRISQCSGGEQQRVRFAIALLGDPDLLLLDEPTTGMDTVARRHFWDAMRAQAKLGKTIIFATHYLEEAQNFASRIVMVNEGRIIADGTTHDIQALTNFRMISCDFPRLSDLMVSDIGRAPGVLSAVRIGNGVRIQANNSDAVARWLLTNTSAFNLTISSNSLEDSFIALTQQALSAEEAGN